MLTKQFVDKMYINMWQYINPDVINHMLNTELSFMRRKAKTKSKHANTICFEGNINDGHYKYVDNLLIEYGTYENSLIHTDDDGICHGAAIAFYINNNYESPKFRIIKNPNTHRDYIKNYITILNVYVYLINSNLWNEALSIYFYNDVTWNDDGSCEQTIKSLHILNKYIKKLQNMI